MDINSELSLAHPKVGCDHHQLSHQRVHAHLPHGVLSVIGICLQDPPWTHYLIHSFLSLLCYRSAKGRNTDKKRWRNQDNMRVGRLMKKVVESNVHSILRTKVSVGVLPLQLTNCETLGTMESLWTAVSSSAGWGQPFPLCREPWIIQQDVVDKHTFKFV